MLATKMKRAKVGLAETKKAFDELSSSITEENRTKWSIEEAKALMEGGSALSVYSVQLQKGK